MPASETRVCQNCKDQFAVEPEDFDFYNKVNVPPPTWCPECRLVRRLTVLNHQALYKRQCSLCGQNMISMYPAGTVFPVYCPTCWWSDKWDPSSYGADYDFRRSFLQQFRELTDRTPHISLMGMHQTWTNSPYNNLAQELKNCYLLFNSDFNENCLYGSEIESSRDCMDNMMIESSQLVFHSVHIMNCSSAFYCLDCENSQNIWFSKDLVGCTDCFGCINLRNQKYHIFNKPYSKEDYAKELAAMGLDSWRNVQDLSEKVDAFRLGYPRKFMHGRQNANNVSGDYIDHCKNVRDSYIALESQDCRYCMWLIIKGNKDCYDYTQFGENAQLAYEDVVCGKNTTEVKFSSFCVNGGTRLQYAEHCYGSCSDLFGCAYMHNSKFCILNKQYTEGEYKELLPRIIQQMDALPYTDAQGRTYKYGEFFPPELSAFAYNESMAQQYFPLDKPRALAQGFRWKDPETKNYQVDLPAADLPDSIRDADESILAKVIGCAHAGQCQEQCATAFRIIPEELNMLKRLNLPLPRLCFNCRHYQRLQQRNPLQLWMRQCQCAGSTSSPQTGAGSGRGAYKNFAVHPHGQDSCSNRFQTAYAPERPEIVYCESCYQAETA